ncbi:MAG: hypothetical protein ACD_79C00187G0001 [uncultured bacterium]|nr:MAG: hypothetical protein ACD_79C00187G0001 [uncultured bacterium]
MHKSRINEIRERLKKIDAERLSLIDELKILEQPQNLPLLFGAQLSGKIPSNSEEKIKLFANLFRCRMDVYPKLWENVSNGKKGYSPACKNEWENGICQKPKIKCSDCKNRIFLPLDENTIRKHLEGKVTIGTYAIKEDDTCIFLAADFDKTTWQDDILAYKSAGSDMGVQISVERSRSRSCQVLLKLEKIEKCSGTK